MSRAKDLFFDALDQPPAARAAWLRAACGADRALFDEVASLLGHHDDAPLLAEPTPIAETDWLDLCGTVLDDRYRVEAPVAEGGFGYVYRAQRLRWDEPVAVKVFKPIPGADHAALERSFLREGRLLNRLSRRTTAIVQCHDVGTLTSPRGEPLLFTVLEWLDGHSLADRPAPDRAWPLAEVIATLAPVAEALQVAHGKGVAHRDVKPSNIFLAFEDGERWVKLLDFGLAKVASQSGRGFLSTGGEGTGMTVRYAAPEQVTGAATGPWTDVYALAMVMVELLAGGHPYADANLFEAMMAVGDPARRPTPRSMGVAVSDAMEGVFGRALACQREARYADVAAFWGALGG